MQTTFRGTKTLLIAFQSFCLRYVFSFFVMILQKRKSIPKKGIVESAFNSNVPMHVIECEFKDVDEVEVEKPRMGATEASKLLTISESMKSSLSSDILKLFCDLESRNLAVR